MLTKIYIWTWSVMLPCRTFATTNFVRPLCKISDKDRAALSFILVVQNILLKTIQSAIKRTYAIVNNKLHTQSLKFSSIGPQRYKKSNCCLFHLPVNTCEFESGTSQVCSNLILKDSNKIRRIQNSCQ